MLFRSYSNRLAKALNTIGAVRRAKQTASQNSGGDVYDEKTAKTLLARHLEMLLAYLNNTFEETIFEGNRIKKQQRQEVMLKHLETLIMNSTKPAVNE